MKLSKSVGRGEVVTLLWNNASAAKVGRRPIGSPKRDQSRTEDCKTIPLRSTPSSCSNQVSTQVLGVPYDSPNKNFGEFQRLNAVRYRFTNCLMETASSSTPQKSPFFLGAIAVE